jgi:hypothetical protein
MLRIVGCSALVVAVALGGCAAPREQTEPETVAPLIEIGGVEAAAALPASYKADILSMLRVYLRDPTGIRNAGISGILQAKGRARRQLVCLRFDAKSGTGDYSGLKERVAVFLNGRLEQMIEAPPGQCADAVYAPFPEAERLSRY